MGTLLRFSPTIPRDKSFLYSVCSSTPWRMLQPVASRGQPVAGRGTTDRQPNPATRTSNLASLGVP
jgi:hypothetical protein